MSIDTRRARTAIVLPVIVFAIAAVIAIAIGILLHQVPHGWPPVVALVLVLIVTAAGFIASYAGSDRDHP
jgi:CHASE2 domain-containing sensor protein